MARPPRIDAPDGLYHVTSRGNGRQVIFWTDADRHRLLVQVACQLTGMTQRVIGEHYGAITSAMLDASYLTPTSYWQKLPIHTRH